MSHHFFIIQRWHYDSRKKDWLLNYSVAHNIKDAEGMIIKSFLFSANINSIQYLPLFRCQTYFLLNFTYFSSRFQWLIGFFSSYFLIKIMHRKSLNMNLSWAFFVQKLYLHSSCSVTVLLFFWHFFLLFCLCCCFPAAVCYHQFCCACFTVFYPILCFTRLDVWEHAQVLFVSD